MEQAEASLKTVEGTMSEATATLSELKDVLKAFTEGNGSMAQLMNDKALYENLESTTNNLNLLIQDIRLNPRRYFKLFGKKVPAYEYPENDPAVKDQE
jgi:phospholipid/cholesterol/gamma-HCH transport system substrate-binding protein